MAWYYASNAGRTGPITESELVTLTRNGTVTPGTLVWTEGQPDWMPLSIVRPDLLAGQVSGVNVPVVGGVALAGANKDMAVQRMREGYAPGIEAANYAGFWIRFVAKFVDGIIVGVAMMICFIPFFVMAAAGADSTGEPPAAMLVMMPIVTIAPYFIQVLYNGFTVGKWGATPGKKMLGLRVVTPDMQPVSMGRAFGRAGGEIVTGFTFTIGYIIAGFDAEKRALHDHIASTRVITTR
jgi:uncharacterized RDD family membrane protein YckC